LANMGRGDGRGDTRGGLERGTGMASELPTRNFMMNASRRPAEQGIDAQRVLAGIWRRRKLCLAVGLVVFAVGYGVVSGSPNVYRAEATMRVEQARVSPELVNPTVTQLIEDRLKTIQSELFARPILEQVVQEQNLYPDVVKKSGISAAAAELRRHLDVKVEGENAFDLTFEDSDPQIAANVANRLPELFAEETLSVRAQQAALARDLFDDELAKLSVEVSAQEKKLGEFKVAHLGELPEQMEANMRGLERTTMLLGTRSDALHDAERRHAEASKGKIDADTDAGRLGHRESDLKAQLDTAKSQYTDDHPEVQRLTREVQSVHSERTSSEAALRAADTTLAETAGEVREMEREVNETQQQVDTYRQRIDNTPRWSAPLAQLDRQYEILKNKYQQMMSRKVEAEVAQDQELRDRAQMFHVLSAAAVPAQPARPDRTAGMMLVTLAALALALLTGVVLELHDDSLREVSDAHAALNLPVLAAVPNLKGSQLLGSGKKLRPAVNRPTTTTLDA